MARIISTGTAVPEHVLERADMERWTSLLFAGARDLRARLHIVGRSGVGRRHLVLPPERLIEPRAFAEKNADYARFAIPLAEQAARRALDGAGLAADRVDLIVTTSCTGILIPSLEAHLAPRLGLRADVVRLPITELGCAAGAAAVARANDFVTAHPGAQALVVAVEITSLTFERRDDSLPQFVAAALFGDGAAAAVLGGERTFTGVGAGASRLPSAELRRSRTHLWPDSTRLMGFDLGEGGFRIVLAREVPDFLGGRVRPLVDALCEEEGISSDALEFGAVHPGGRRIVDVLAGELPMLPVALDLSRQVLESCGNMSSATVLFVLDRMLRRRPSPRVGSWGLLAAFGPGFAAELSLLRWPDGR